MFDLLIQADLADVPPPSAPGRALVFMHPDGYLAVKLFDGSIARVDDESFTLATNAATAAAAADTKATNAATAAATADTKATNAATAAATADTKATNAANVAAAADTKATNAATAAATADTKATNAANVAAAAGLAADVLTGATLNAPRAGVVAGLLIQSVTKPVPIGRVIRFTGSLKLVSTAVGSVNVELNIGGLIVPFVAVAVSVSTQIFNFYGFVEIVAAGVGYASINQSIAASGASSAVGNASNAATTGTVTTGVIAVNFKSPTTTTVTTQAAIIELL